MPIHTHTQTTHSRFQDRLKEQAASGTLPHLLFFLPIPDLPLNHHQRLHPPEPRDPTSGTWWEVFKGRSLSHREVGQEEGESVLSP